MTHVLISAILNERKASWINGLLQRLYRSHENQTYYNYLERASTMTGPCEYFFCERYYKEFQQKINNVSADLRLGEMFSIKPSLAAFIND